MRRQAISARSNRPAVRGGFRARPTGDRPTGPVQVVRGFPEALRQGQGLLPYRFAKDGIGAEVCEDLRPEQRLVEERPHCFLGLLTDPVSPERLDQGESLLPHGVADGVVSDPGRHRLRGRRLGEQEPDQACRLPLVRQVPRPGGAPSQIVTSSSPLTARRRPPRSNATRGAWAGDPRRVRISCPVSASQSFTSL